MSQTSSSETPVTKLARFIVDKRKAFFLVFLAAVLFCGSSIDKVVVNNDITSYLPAETETRRGLTLMDEEFTTYASAQVMLSNVTYRQAEKVAAQLAELDGVSSVAFDDSTDHFKDSSALFSVSFTGEEGSPEADAALAAVKELAAPYDHYVFPSGDPYDSDSLMQEMTVILAIAAAVIVAVLLFTSKSYLEVLVFLIVFVVSAILNMGTNFLFDSVSFITNAIAVVLQLALAIDYAIIFCHRYMEERDNGLDAREADIAALSKAIVEISSSSLTTISGLVALMLMQFRIGFDMGIVLSKGIVCSMLSVFLLMPGLLMLFNRGIEKTRHKNLVPSIAAVSYTHLRAHETQPGHRKDPPQKPSALHRRLGPPHHEAALRASGGVRRVRHRRHLLLQPVRLCILHQFHQLRQPSGDPYCHGQDQRDLRLYQHHCRTGSPWGLRQRGCGAPPGGGPGQRDDRHRLGQH